MKTETQADVRYRDFLQNRVWPVFQKEFAPHQRDFFTNQNFAQKVSDAAASFAKPSIRKRFTDLVATDPERATDMALALFSERMRRLRRTSPQRLGRRPVASLPPLVVVADGKKDYRVRAGMPRIPSLSHAHSSWRADEIERSARKIDLDLILSGRLLAPLEKLAFHCKRANFTNREIARELGCSEEYARQILKKAQAKLSAQLAAAAKAEREVNDKSKRVATT